MMREIIVNLPCQWKAVWFKSVHDAYDIGKGKETNFHTIFCLNLAKV